MHSKKGTRIEIACFSEWLANSKELVSFSEWLADRITLRTKKGASIEIASFSEWLADRKRCAQRKGTRMQIASFAEWRASKNRELFIVSFGSEGLITSENSCREIAGLFRMAQRGHVQTLTPGT